MWAATRSATAGSSHSQSVDATSTTPSTTPAEVQTSVIRWPASASSATERPARLARGGRGGRRRPPRARRYCPGGQDDHDSLDGGGEVLGFEVAVGVPFV